MNTDKKESKTMPWQRSVTGCDSLARLHIEWLKCGEYRALMTLGLRWTKFITHKDGDIFSSYMFGYFNG